VKRQITDRLFDKCQINVLLYWLTLVQNEATLTLQAGFQSEILLSPIV